MTRHSGWRGRISGFVLVAAAVACRQSEPAPSPPPPPTASPTPTPAAAPTPTPAPTPAAAAPAAGCAQLQGCCTAIGTSLGGGTQRDCQSGLVGGVDATCRAKLAELRTMASNVGAELPAACH